MDPDEDLDLDEQDQDDDTGSPDAGDGSGAPPAGNAGPKKSNEAKRIEDLMSKWQTAEAENARLKSQLEGKGPQGEPGGEQIPEAVRQWMNAAKDAARDRFFNSDPRFAEYGIDLSLIEGEDPDAMKASAARIKSLIDAVESKARERVLRDHGIEADVQGSAPAPKVDFATMDDETFDKYVGRVKR